MSKSNLEKSQADTDHSSASEETLDSFPPSAPSPESKRAAVLSAVYAVVMAAISALLLQRHSPNWKRWAIAVGVIFYVVGRSTIKSRGEK